MRRRLPVILSLLIAMALPAVAWSAPAEMKAKKCLKCHGEWKSLDNVALGEFQSRSNKAKSISVLIKPGVTRIIKFTPQTKVENVPSIKKLKKPIPVHVVYVKKGADLVATEIIAKPMIKVPKDQLVDAKWVADMLAGKKGKFLLVDSRPPIRYNEGRIPGSVSIPFPKMPDLMAKLPKDKNQLLVFYCGGFR